MYGFMQRNGKKLLAVVGVALMVVFIIPQSSFNGGPAAGKSVMGRFGGAAGDATSGTAVTADDLRSAAAQLQELSRILRREGDQFYPLPLIDLAQRVGNQNTRSTFERLTADKAGYWLLLQEAARSGSAAGPEDVDQALDGLLYRADGSAGPADAAPINTLAPATQAGLRASVAGWLTVMNRFDRARDAVKLSRPLVRRAVGRQFQQIDLRLVGFSAADYADQVPQPTDADLETFFKRHADQTAGEPTADNPFGFGYRVPARVKYQYVSVPTAAVEQAVRGEKSDYDWEVLARKYYLAHPEEFRPEPPTSDSATQPTSKPAVPPFAQVRGRAIEAVVRPVVEQRRESILDVLRQRMKGESKTFDSLKAAAEEVQKRFGVAVAPADRTAEWSTESQLRGEPGLGDATAYLGAGLSARPVPFAEYALSAAATSAAPADPSDEGSAGTPAAMIKVMQPSEPLEQSAAPVGPVSADVPGPSTYVFRLTAADPAHAATVGADLAADKSNVAADWKRERAFDLAKTAADATVAKARAAQPSDDALKSVAGDRRVLDTGLFGESSFRPESAGLSASTNPANPADPTAAAAANALARTFAGSAFDLLSLPGTSDHPVGRIDVPTAGRSFAAQVAEVQPIWADSSQREKLEAAALGQMRQEQMQAAAGTPKSNWFTPAAVAARVGYQPTARDSGPAPSSNAPAPTVPRIGS